MTTLDNNSMRNELASEFIRRNDLVTRWGLTISSFLAIPGLVGFWPMSSVDKGTGAAYDLSGQGRTLTRNGNPMYNWENFTPYIDFDGTGDYLSRASETALNITGTETVFVSAKRGLTVGGWFRADGSGATDGLIGKLDTGGNQRSYLLLTISGDLNFITSSNGTAEHTTPGLTLTPGNWTFVVGRLIPGISSTLYHLGSTVNVAQNTTSVPASIFASTADFQIGAYNAGTQNFAGWSSLCFLSANWLSEPMIVSLFHQSRVLFGI